MIGGGNGPREGERHHRNSHMASDLTSRLSSEGGGTDVQIKGTFSQSFFFSLSRIGLWEKVPFICTSVPIGKKGLRYGVVNRKHHFALKTSPCDRGKRADWRRV